MARDDDEKPERGEKSTKPRVTVGDEELTIKRAHERMASLTEEASQLRDDETSAAKTRRVEIARTLRMIQRQLDGLEELVDVVVDPRDSKQFPFRIGPAEFWPGTHRVRKSVAQTLRYMIDQHKMVETNRTIDCGNAPGDSYGRELPPL